MIKLNTQWIAMAVSACLLTQLPVNAATPVALGADLEGMQEVPGPGSMEGSGTVKLSLNPKTMEVCYEVSVDGLTEFTAAHIHIGAKGVSGPVVLALEKPVGNKVSKSCTTASEKLIEQLTKNPTNYYYNVHTALYKDGALRGQFSAINMMKN